MHFGSFPNQCLAHLVLQTQYWATCTSLQHLYLSDTKQMMPLLLENKLTAHNTLLCSTIHNYCMISCHPHPKLTGINSFRSASHEEYNKKKLVIIFKKLLTFHFILHTFCRQRKSTGYNFYLAICNISLFTLIQNNNIINTDMTNWETLIVFGKSNTIEFYYHETKYSSLHITKNNIKKPTIA